MSIPIQMRFSIDCRGIRMPLRNMKGLASHLMVVWDLGGEFGVSSLKLLANIKM